MVGRPEKHFSAGHSGLQDSVVQSLASASGDEWGRGNCFSGVFQVGNRLHCRSKGHTEDQVSQVWPLSLLALSGHCAAQQGSFFLIYSQLLIGSAVFDSGLISGAVQDIRHTTIFISFGTGYTHLPIPSDAHEGVYPRLNGYASKRAWFKSRYTSPGTIAPPDLMACPHTPISLKAQRWPWQQSLWPQQEALGTQSCCSTSAAVSTPGVSCAWELEWLRASHGTVISTMKSDFGMVWTTRLPGQSWDQPRKTSFWSRSTCISVPGGVLGPVDQK